VSTAGAGPGGTSTSGDPMRRPWRTGGAVTAAHYSRAVTLRFDARPYDDPLVQRLVAEVQQEYVTRYGGPDEAPVDAAEFTPPNGLFVLGLLDEQPVTTGAWRLLEPGVAEIKRMYVSASARRRGLARLMLAELERTAVAAGVSRIVLNTGLAQPEALALYESSGYATIPGFGHYAAAPLARFYGKSLVAHPAADRAGRTQADGPPR
jgi:GNAT superfamily N-acetyltransferase